MDRNKEVQQKTEAFLSEVGMNLAQVFTILGHNKSELLNLDEKSRLIFSDKYEKLTVQDCCKAEKGKLLEDLVGLLFQEGSSKLFNVRRNCRTSTNELDLLLDWTQNARLLSINTAYPCFGDSFICECKNYNRKVGVTSIGKFCSLLVVTGIKLGIMIAWKGITGRGKWDAAQGLIKKIALKEDIYMIVLDKNDLKHISEGKSNIFSIVHEKYLALKAEVEYNEYIRQHEAEKVF